jgi:hypothetical protein
MAGLFRRFRRTKSADVEPAPEPEDVAIEPSPEDAYVPSDETAAVPEPAYDPTSNEPISDAVASPLLEETEPSPSPEVPPEIGPPGGDLAPGPSAPEATAVLPPSPPVIAPPSQTSEEAARPSNAWVPPLPAAGSTSSASPSSMPPTTTCFLCGHRLEPTGYCASCQMTWVE